MPELLIDLATMLNELPDETSAQVKMGLAEIAKRLSAFNDGFAYRIVWLDDGDFVGLLPYLEVMKG